MRNKIMLLLSFFILCLMAQPAYAAGNSNTAFLDNPLAVTLLILMALLLLIIGLLANVLLGTAEIKLAKEKKEDGDSTAGKVLTIAGLLLLSSSVMAQGDNTTAAVKTIAGMSSTTFYVMSGILFLELFVILAMLINIRSLIKAEKAKAEKEAVQKPAFSWWSRFNRFKPVEQEADIDLGHDYDGIRELDNRLPPWWLYGFYITIVFAAIYLWRFHVSHTGPSSAEEYQASVTKAEAKIKEYLKEKGEAVDENTVTLLIAPEDLAEGKKFFITSCASCHKQDGAGDVGPNLTDDYWIHGNDVKSVFKTIRYGINAMPQWQNTYSNKQIAQLTSYVKSLHGTKPANPKAPQGELISNAPSDTTLSTVKLPDQK